MVDQSPARVWLMRCVFLALALLLVLLNLLPLHTLPREWSGPNLVQAIVFAWTMRRPEYVPPLLLAPVLLVVDLLFQNPPGLQAALLLIAAEALRLRAAAARDMPFLVEWFAVAGMIAAIALAERVVLTIFFVPLPSFGLTVVQCTMTILAYPAIVLLSHVLFGVRRAAPGEVDKLGHKL